MVKTFMEWLAEGRDIFGFEGEGERPHEDRPDDGPITPVNGDIILESMLGRKVNGMEAFSDFHDHIQWGREPGAVQMVISPLGSFKSIIRRLQTNLLGERVWVCREIIPYRNMAKASVKFDENMADDIFKKIERCSEGDLAAPSSEYEGLELLTLEVAARSRTKDILPKIMVFRGVRKVAENHYNIHFECRGHGVEAPGGMRLEQFSIDMVYDRKTGMVRSYGYGIQSPTRQHLWQPQPSEWDEIFSPSQNKGEIVSAICSAFSTY